jgi:hypothetical protein
MSQLPGVYSTETDFALGAVASAAGGKLLAIIGPAKSGPIGLPSAFSRWEDAQAIFEGGRLVEAGAYYIERYQRPVLLCRADVTGSPSVSAVDSDAEGSAAVTVAASPAPIDHYQLAVEFLSDGTVGQAGITYRLSLDDGRTWSNDMALGTANTIVFPGAGVSFALAAGTIKRGDIHAAQATAAKPNATNLTAALEGLKLTLNSWEIVLFTETIDADTFDAVTAVSTYANGPHTWIGSPRLPNDGETDAQWQAALAPLSADKASAHGGLYAGGCKLASPISGRRYQRPAGWPVAAAMAAVAPHVNIAETRRGPLPGVSIRDENGMPDEHDEALFPGLEAMRFGSLRTWPRRQGVYVTRARTFAATGSDFTLYPNRRVINLAREVLTDYLTDRCHRPILVSRKTGLILPSEAKDIELGGDAVLRAALLAEPMASAAYFRISRTDNLLSVPALNSFGRVLPLAYPEWINLNMSLENPALQIQAV